MSGKYQFASQAMNGQLFATINRYYEACWSTFSSQPLHDIFDSDIIWTGSNGERVEDKDEVIQLYVDNFFEKTKPESIRIKDFSLVDLSGVNGKQVRATYHVQEIQNFKTVNWAFQEILTFDDDNYRILGIDRRNLD